MSIIDEMRREAGNAERSGHTYESLLMTEWADRLAAENTELRGKLDDVRMGIGCARGQRTTQYCADLTQRDEVIRRLLAMLKPPIIAHGPNDEWGAYCETCWWSGSARDAKWTGIDNECDGSCPVCGKGIEEYTGDERTEALYRRALEIVGRTK